MQYSKQGIDLTKSFESCRLTTYRDIKGVLTIGFGHTGPEVVEGLTWTQNQADSQLVLDLTRAEHAVNTLVTVPMTQGVFDSLVDFCYNCGIGAFSGSTMLKLLNAGQNDDAANEFEKWDHASGKVVAGLLRRRLAEKEEFNG
jgi:lysozyme